MNKLFKNYLFLLLAALSVLVVSCKDDEEEPDISPIITSVTPDQGTPGTTVTISGSNLVDATVSFGNETAAIDNNTETSITTSVPANAAPGQQTITVTTDRGTTTAGFTVLEAPEPATITSVEPVTGGAGTRVTITGTNLTGITGLRIGDTEVAADDFQIDEAGETVTFTVPEGATEGFTGPITVTTAEGEDVVGPEDVTFTFDPALTPTVTAIDPENRTGVVGDVITITGTNFEGAQVFFVGADGEEVEAEVDETSTTEELIVTIPEGAQTGPIIIRTPQGAVQTEEFSIGEPAAEATITGVIPTTVGPGSTVTITGTNLTGITGLRIGDTEVAANDFQVDEAGENITFTVPEGATEGFTGPITVTTAEGQEVVGPEDVTLTFATNAPVITAIDPEARTGAVGDVVTITGRNLAVAEVFFTGADDAEIQATVEATSTPEELIFTVPEGAQTGPIIIRVTTQDGEQFEVQIEEFTIGEAASE